MSDQATIHAGQRTEPAVATPLGGAFKEGVHSLALRIYYEDTDAGGIVYYANYLKYLERARSDFLRALGFAQTDMARPRAAGGNGILFVVRRCNLEFRRPAVLDDIVEVRTALERVGGASLEMAQWIMRADVRLVTAKVGLACVDTNHKPARLPHVLRAALNGYCRSYQPPQSEEE